MRRRRKEIAAAIGKIQGEQPLAGPGEPYVAHKRWASVRRLWKGYYGSA